jgi:hypothetical protein
MLRLRANQVSRREAQRRPADQPIREADRDDPARFVSRLNPNPVMEFELSSGRVH